MVGIKTTYKRGEDVEWVRFAWLPIKSDDGKIYWLKKLTWTFKCDLDQSRHPRVTAFQSRQVRWDLISVLP